MLPVVMGTTALGMGMGKPNYPRMFATTALATWLLLLAYAGWVIARASPVAAFGPLRAENALGLHLNALIAAGEIGLIRTGLTAFLRGDLWQRDDR